MKLVYDKPAAVWTEALPVGNGRLGGMIYGGVEREVIGLNEDTLWSGYPQDGSNPGAKEVLPEIREVIRQGRYIEADALGRRMLGPYTQSYLPFGELLLCFEHGDVSSEYRRTLDLEDAVHRVSYAVGSVTYTREIFASHPDQVLVLRLASGAAGRLNFHARLDSPLRHHTLADGAAFVLRGIAPEHVDPGYFATDNPIRYGNPGQSEGMRFEGRIAVRTEDGEVTVDEGGVHVHGASAAVLIFSAATSFSGFDRLPGSQGREESALAAAMLEQALVRPYGELLARHRADYRPLFGRVELKLGAIQAAEELTTDRRIAEWGAQDPGMAELLFQYGRYLLIASSRPGTQAANLQGIWNASTRPPWSSNYTLNINTEMNYWPAEVCNLAECHEPLLSLVGRLAQNGARTAAVNYGARGWTAHHNADIWGHTAPAGHFGDGDPSWAFWPMGGIWLTQHLWEHYAFGGDEDYLRSFAYPVMKEAACFALDWLQDDGQGRLVTSPSTSPEHKFRTPEGTAAVSAGATMDISLIWELFTNCLEAEAVLGGDPGFRAEVEQARARLLPLQTGRYGQLQEWAHDWEDEDRCHRHTSHLVGVYPGRQLSKEETPELFRAARVSLERRGDESTGWSLGWRVALWSRFRDGERAHALLANMLRLVRDDGREVYSHGGGVYANLLGAHPPFQIDSNFAASAGIAEMLLQSHLPWLELLPALPQRWADGHTAGLRARGGFEVNLRWAGGRLAEAEIASKLGAECRVRTGVPLLVTCEGQQVSAETGPDGVLRFATERGKRYTLVPVHA